MSDNFSKEFCDGELEYLEKIRSNLIPFTFIVDRDKFAFVIASEMPLSWVGFGLETGLLWFLGRACFRFQIKRWGSQKQNFCVTPLDARRGLVWSNIVTLKYLHQQVLFPQKLVQSWKKINENETLLGFDWVDDFPKETLGFVAYGLADLSVDLFKRGAKTVRAQYSVERAEIWADIGLSQDETANLMSRSTRDYEPHETVSALS